MVKLNGKFDKPNVIKVTIAGAGPAGKTPIKGVDYFTTEDINEIVNAVYAKVANGNEVAY